MDVSRETFTTRVSRETFLSFILDTILDILDTILDKLWIFWTNWG